MGCYHLARLSYQYSRHFRKSGFTLAELLITLAILGIIAAFAIPKILQAQQSAKFNSIAKEAGTAMAAAYQTAKLNNGVNGNTRMTDLLPYLNYVSLNTSTTVNNRYAGAAPSLDCSDPTLTCVVLHSGAIMTWKTNQCFSGTSTTNAVEFQVDPDGTYIATNDSKAARFILYYTGSLRTDASVLTSSSTSGLCNGTTATYPAGMQDPPWFSWSQ